MSAEIHVDDVGTVFTATIRDETGAAVDVSGAGVLGLVFNKPDGTPVYKTATLAGTGEDGVIQYITVSGDIDQAGNWRVQGYVKIGTSEFHSYVHAFRVHSNLPLPPS